MKTNKILWVITFIFSTLFAVQLLQASDGVDVKTAQTMQQKGALLLDVREPSEYSDVHAPNATLIPLGQLSSRLQEIATHKDQPVLVVCRSGGRSAKAVTILEKAGYSQVNNVNGGMNAWESEGLAVIKQ
ncbi:MAG: rhodanese-like domain-containing protein [Gallionella sp.]